MVACRIGGDHWNNVLKAQGDKRATMQGAPGSEERMSFFASIQQTRPQWIFGIHKDEFLDAKEGVQVGQWAARERDLAKGRQVKQMIDSLIAHAYAVVTKTEEGGSGFLFAAILRCRNCGLVLCRPLMIGPQTTRMGAACGDDFTGSSLPTCIVRGRPDFSMNASKCFLLPSPTSMASTQTPVARGEKARGFVRILRHNATNRFGHCNGSLELLKVTAEAKDVEAALFDGPEANGNKDTKLKWTMFKKRLGMEFVHRMEEKLQTTPCGIKRVYADVQLELTMRRIIAWDLRKIANVKNLYNKIWQLYVQLACHGLGHMNLSVHGEQ